MIYTPVTVTSTNYEYAIHENILLALTVLATKVNGITGGPWPEIDANGNLVRLVGTSDNDNDACTLEKLMELLA